MLDVPLKRIDNNCMVEVKGRKFEGALEELINGDEEFKKLLEDIYDIPEVDEIQLEVPLNRDDNYCMMNKANLLQTQTIENYRLDCESDKPYWKFKGGEEYLVFGTSDRPANAVALVAALSMNNSKA